MVYLLQATSNYIFSLTILIVYKTPFLDRAPGKAFFCLYLKRQEKWQKKKIPDKS